MFTNKTLPEFNLTSIKENSNIIIIGGNSTGKSTLVKNILYHHKYPTTQYVIGPHATDEYTNIPSQNIFGICDNKVINIIKQKIQQNMKQKIKIPIKSPKKKNHKKKNNQNIINKNIINKNTHNIVVYDEPQYNDDWRKNPSIIDMYENNQNYSLTNIYTVKYPCLPKSLNHHANFIFIFAQPNSVGQKLCYQYYSPKNITIEHFNQLLEENTRKPYHCLVIDKEKGELFYYGLKEEIGLHIIEQYFPLQKNMSDIKKKDERDPQKIENSLGLFSWLWNLVF